MGLNDKSENFSVVESQKNMVNVVTKGFKKEGKWLDVGCGTGAPACFLGVSNPNLEIDGINIVKPQIEKANQLSEKYQCDDRVRFHYGDAQQIPFENETYDSVYAIESAFHFDSKLKFIKDVTEMFNSPKGSEYLIIKNLIELHFLIQETFDLKKY